jgi:DNA-binding CsgD family transcriptional regulator
METRHTRYEDEVKALLALGERLGRIQWILNIDSIEIAKIHEISEEQQ